MLSIQPRITGYMPVKPQSFRGNDVPELDESMYKEKVDYYQDQKTQLEKLAESENTPKPFRKILKGVAIVSGAFLEGWAVFWGASKASVFVKKATKSVSNSKFTKKVVDKAIKPMFAFAKKNVAKLEKFTVEKADKLHNSDFAKKKAGKIVVGAVDLMIKFAKLVKKGLKSLVSLVKKPFAKQSADAVYDKAADIASKTLGIGAGVAGGYAAAHNMSSDKKPIAEAA